MSRNFIVCIVVGLLLLVGLFMILMGSRMEIGAAQPIVTPTPSPTPEPVVSVIELTPTPAPVVIAIESRLPEDAVAIVVNDRTLFAMESAEQAEQLLNDYLLISSEVEEGHLLIRAYTEQQVKLKKAEGTEELLDYQAAMSKLLSNPALFSITKVVASCQQTFGEITTETQTNPQLPLNSIFVLNQGSAEKWAIYTETMFKSGVECQRTETNRFKVGDTKNRVVQIGTYYSDAAEPEDGEGKEGPELPKLKFRAPVEGKIVSHFGMRSGAMHNGIDYNTALDVHVHAPEGGVVIFCGERGDYGFVVDILHDEGAAVSRLTHLCNVKVELYQRVARGEQIGDLARGAEGEKIPFHYELIINNIPYDPLQYIK